MPESTPRYAITADQYTDASRYLQRKLTLQPEWTDHPEAADELRRVHRPDGLARWCEKWLSPQQWRQLKAALRAARHRRRQHSRYPGPDIHLRLQREAALILRDLAKHEGVSRSEFILRHHRQRWLALEDPDDDSHDSDLLTATPRCE